MKLAVLEISKFDARAVQPWASDENCLVVSVNTPGECQWRRQPVEMTSYEAIAERHAQLCQPLFDAGAENRGPTLPGAAISFMGAADFTMFIATRFPTTLLLDLERVALEHPIDRVEFVTDLGEGAKYRSAARAFAQSRQLPFNVVSLGATRLSAARRLSRTLDGVVGSIWSHGPAYLDVMRTMARRWAHRRRVDREKTLQHAQPVSRGGAVRAAMLVYHPKSWRYLLPIRAALLAEGHEVLLISPRLECDYPLEAAGVDFVSLPPAMPRAALRRAVASYLNELPWSSDNSALDALVREGGSLRRLTVEHGLAACGAYCDVAVPISELLKRQRINVVLGTDSGSVAGRCFYRAAARLGAPGVFVQHGSVHALAGVRQYMLDTYRLLWGTNSCEMLARSNVDRPERIVCLGSPFHEARDGFSGERTAVVDARVAPVALVTFGVPGGYVAVAPFRRAAEAVIAAAREFGEVKFIVKPHPGDPGNVWRELIARHELANVELEIQRDTYELMRHCGLLLTMFSTTGSEAICLGKPVISINPDDRPGGEEYLKAGAAYSVRDQRGLVDAMREIFNNPSGGDRLGDVRRACAESFFHREERPAALRAVDFLSSLVNGPHTENPGSESAMRTMAT